MYLSIIIDVILSITPVLGGIYLMILGFHNKKEHIEFLLYGVGILLVAAALRLFSFSSRDSLVELIAMSVLIGIALVAFIMSAIKWAIAKGMFRKVAFWLQSRIKSAKSRRRQPRLVKAKKRK